MGSQPGHGGRLSAQEVARFTAVVALLAIFSDAAVGHGLMRENELVQDC